MAWAHAPVPNRPANAGNEAGAPSPAPGMAPYASGLALAIVSAVLVDRGVERMHAAAPPREAARRRREAATGLIGGIIAGRDAPIAG